MRLRRKANLTSKKSNCNGYFEQAERCSLLPRGSRHAFDGTRKENRYCRSCSLSKVANADNVHAEQHIPPNISGVRADSQLMYRNLRGQINIYLIDLALSQKQKSPGAGPLGYCLLPMA